MSALFFHGNFQSEKDFAEYLPKDVEVFPLWEFLRKHPVNSWQEFISQVCVEINFDKYTSLIGYSLGGRILLNLLTGGGSRKRSGGPIRFLSTHPGLHSDEEKNARRKTDDAWKKSVLESDWKELFTCWNAQDIFANSSADWENFSSLEKYRPEIARAFEVLSLASMPVIRAEALAPTISWHWFVGAQDQKFLDLGRRFCCEHPEKLHIIENAGHRLYLDLNAQAQLVKIV